MMTTRHLAGLAAAFALAAPAFAQATPAGRLSAYDDQVIAVMKAKLPIAQRADRFGQIVTQFYDMAGIAQTVAGTAWASASAADRQAFQAALTRHSAVSLAQNFDRFDGQRFTVDPAVQMRGTSAIAKLTIMSSGSTDILYFRMRQASGGWRIVDVISGGVSQLAVQRSDLQATIADGGLAAAAKRLAQIDGKTLRR